MHKTNQKRKKIFESFLKVFIIILIILFNRSIIVYGANNDWFEVSKTDTGIQYLDRGSIDNKGKGIIELTTKYLKFDTDGFKTIEEKIYTMRINCFTNEFKDISVNGKKILNAKWEEPNGDKLINDVISDSCKNV